MATTETRLVSRVQSVKGGGQLSEKNCAKTPDASTCRTSRRGQVAHLAPPTAVHGGCRDGPDGLAPTRGASTSAASGIGAKTSTCRITPIEFNINDAEGEQADRNKGGGSDTSVAYIFANREDALDGMDAPLTSPTPHQLEPATSARAPLVFLVQGSRKRRATLLREMIQPLTCKHTVHGKKS